MLPIIIGAVSLIAYGLLDENSKPKAVKKMAKGGNVKSFDKIFEEYEENEDNNYHSENVVLLAKNFGGAEDLKLAKSILKKHESEGSLSEELNKQRSDLSKKLYPKLIASKNKMAKGGTIKEGDIFGNYSITKYSPIKYDDLGGSTNGLVKLVNQEDFDTILIQYDNSLRGGKWFVSKNGILYEGKSPNEVINKLNLNKMAKGGAVADFSSVNYPTINQTEENAKKWLNSLIKEKGRKEAESVVRYNLTGKNPFYRFNNSYDNWLSSAINNDKFAKGGAVADEELKEALKKADGSNIFSQDFLDKYVIVKETFSPKKYDDAEKSAKEKKAELQQQGYLVKLKKVGFSDLARSDAYFVTAIKRKFAKGGNISNEEQERFNELNEKINSYLKGMGQVSSKEMVEHAKLKHKINLAKSPLYKKQIDWEKSNNFGKGGNIKYGSVVYEVVKDSNGYKIINKYDLGDEEKNFNEYFKEKSKRKPFLDSNNWRLDMILFNFKRFKKENLFDFIPNEKLEKIYDKYSKGGAVDMYPKFDLNKSGNYFATINNKNYEIIYRDDKSQMYDLFQNNKKIKSDRSIRNLMKFPKIYKDGGMIESQIDALYEKSGFINDDFNWKLKLIEMLEDSSIEAYQIYQKLNSKQKEEVLQELFSMNNDMGADGDGEIETSRENLEILLEDAKNGKKYAKGGSLKAKKKKDYSQNRNPELDKKYMAEKKGTRVSQKVAQIERRDGTIFKRRNANQYGRTKGGNTYVENRDNRSDKRVFLEKGGEVDTWENILVDYGFKKSRTKLGVRYYKKRGYFASVDNRRRIVELYFDDIELYSGYSIQGLIDELEKEFKH